MLKQREDMARRYELFRGTAFHSQYPLQETHNNRYCSFMGYHAGLLGHLHMWYIHVIEAGTPTLQENKLNLKE